MLLEIGDGFRYVPCKHFCVYTLIDSFSQEYAGRTSAAESDCTIFGEIAIVEDRMCSDVLPALRPVDALRHTQRAGHDAGERAIGVDARDMVHGRAVIHGQQSADIEILRPVGHRNNGQHLMVDGRLMKGRNEASIVIEPEEASG